MKRSARIILWMAHQTAALLLAWAGAVEGYFIAYWFLAGYIWLFCVPAGALLFAASLMGWRDRYPTPAAAHAVQYGHFCAVAAVLLYGGATVLLVGWLLWVLAYTADAAATYLAHAE